MFSPSWIKKSPDAALVAFGSLERLNYTIWNLTLINLINCTWIYRQFLVKMANNIEINSNREMTVPVEIKGHVVALFKVHKMGFTQSCMGMRKPVSNTR